MRKIVALCLVCLSSLAWAESIHTMRQHDCVSPVRPVNDQDDQLWQRFLDDIDGYRACINREMEWHQSAALDHQQQAKVVVDEWNEFVRTNLNAPEDFPWPPEEESFE